MIFDNSGPPKNVRTLTNEYLLIVYFVGIFL